MKSTIEKMSHEVQHVIETLEELQRLPIATATERSLRMAIALLHGALDAIDAARFETTSASRDASLPRASAR